MLINLTRNFIWQKLKLYHFKCTIRCALFVRMKKISNLLEDQSSSTSSHSPLDRCPETVVVTPSEFHFYNRFENEKDVYKSKITVMNTTSSSVLVQVLCSHPSLIQVLRLDGTTVNPGNKVQSYVVQHPMTQQPRVALLNIVIWMPSQKCVINKICIPIYINCRPSQESLNEIHEMKLKLSKCLRDAVIIRKDDSSSSPSETSTSPELKRASLLKGPKPRFAGPVDNVGYAGYCELRGTDFHEDLQFEDAADALCYSKGLSSSDNRLFQRATFRPEFTGKGNRFSSVGSSSQIPNRYRSLPHVSTTTETKRGVSVSMYSFNDEAPLRLTGRNTVEALAIPNDSVISGQRSDTLESDEFLCLLVMIMLALTWLQSDGWRQLLSFNYEVISSLSRTALFFTSLGYLLKCFFVKRR